MRSFVKKVSQRKGGAPEAIAQEEFNTAERFYAAYPSNDDYGVVKPYRLVADKQLLLFEYIDGRNASDLLLELRTDEQIELLSRMGAWLRRFHDATKPTERPADLPERLGSLEARCGDNRPTSRVFGQALAYLSRELRLGSQSSSQHVGLHGDCKAENFLIRGNQVIGVDVAWKHRNAAEYDLGQFLSQLTLLARSVRGRRLSGFVERLEGAFLRGYGVTRPDSIRTVNWLKAYYYLSYWLSWRERGYLKRLFWDRYFTLLLKDFLRTAAGARDKDRSPAMPESCDGT